MKVIESKRIDDLYKKLNIHNEDVTVRNNLNIGTLCNKLALGVDSSQPSSQLLNSEKKQIR